MKRGRNDIFKKKTSIEKIKSSTTSQLPSLYPQGAALCKASFREGYNATMWVFIVNISFLEHPPFIEGDSIQLSQMSLAFSIFSNGIYSQET